MNTMNITIKIALASIIVALFTLFCVPGYSQIQVENEYDKKLRIPLTAFKAKYAKELSAIPHLTLLASATENHDAFVLAEQGRNALSLGNLEEAEGAFASSLSLRENGLNRLTYSEILIEEKKYLAALPSCAEVALVDHFNYTKYSMANSIELDSAPHILLAFVLAQIGDLKTSAIVYNYARSRCMATAERDIKVYKGWERERSINYRMKLSLPEIPKEFDPELATRPQLLQALRLLLCVGRRGSLEASLIKDAYEIAPESPFVTYLRGITMVIKPKENMKERLARTKSGFPFIIKAVAIADPKSELGKLALKTLTDFEKDIKRMQTEVDEHRAAFDNP